MCLAKKGRNLPTPPVVSPPPQSDSFLLCPDIERLCEEIIIYHLVSLILLIDWSPHDINTPVASSLLSIILLHPFLKGDFPTKSKHVSVQEISTTRERLIPHPSETVVKEMLIFTLFSFYHFFTNSNHHHHCESWTNFIQTLTCFPIQTLMLSWMD